MIRVDRGPVEAPAVLGKTAARALGELRAFYRLGEVHRSQHRYGFDETLWNDLSVRRALAELCHRKCAFCETRLTGPQALEVAHFRPCEKSTGIEKGRIARDHYWWLAYDWDNLYPICRTCHRYKRNSFPVDRSRVEPEAGGRDLRAERPLLLDPCADQPEDDLDYDHHGKMRGRTLRAEVTIEVLGLNRPELVRRRGRPQAQALLRDGVAGQLLSRNGPGHLPAGDRDRVEGAGAVPAAGQDPVRLRTRPPPGPMRRDRPVRFRERCR